MRDICDGKIEALFFLQLAYSSGFDSVEGAKRMIRDHIIVEKRKIIASAQQTSNKFIQLTKICRECGFPKSVSDFKEKIDKRTQFRYYNPMCKQCETAHYTSEAYREKRRKTQSTESAKIKSRQRYLRFKMKHALQIAN